MAGKLGDYNVQRHLENRQISERIQIRPADGDLSPDLFGSLFNMEPLENHLCGVHFCMAIPDLSTS